MVRHTDATDDESTPEHAADQYAANPTTDAFRDVVDAVEAEYERDGHDPETSTVLTPVGLAARLCADAIGFDASSRIGFDYEDAVTVPYNSFETSDPHATPIDAVRVVVHAADVGEENGRTVRYRDGAGEVRMLVEVPARVPDEDDE